METPSLPSWIPVEWAIPVMIIGGLCYGGYKLWRWIQPDMRAERAVDEKVRRRTKRRLGRAYEWGEAAEAELYNGRSDRRKHDDEHHPDGDGAIGIRELPPQLKHGIRDWASQGEGEDD